MCLQCISFMIEVTLPRTISLNERCTLLSHAICQIALLLDRVFASLSLSYTNPPTRAICFHFSFQQFALHPPRGPLSHAAHNESFRTSAILSGRSIFAHLVSSLFRPRKRFRAGFMIRIGVNFG